MLNKFIPNKQVKSVFEIHPKDLKEKGFKGVIVDLDNTLVAWDQAYATPEVIEWLDLLAEYDLKVTIISNNSSRRVRTFSEPLNVPYIAGAIKPLTRAFKQGVKRMGLSKNEVVVIGDQLLTDIFGGNRAGLYTVLVVPIVQSDAAVTTFNRRLERMIYNRLHKQGKIL